jgi:hypothetical protein
VRRVKCVLPEGATIAVHLAETGRMFRGGDEVDLEAIAAPAAGDRPALTWGDALGSHAATAFEPVAKSSVQTSAQRQGGAAAPREE